MAIFDMALVSSIFTRAHMSIIVCQGMSLPLWVEVRASAYLSLPLMDYFCLAGDLFPYNISQPGSG